MKVVTVHQAKTHLSRLLRGVERGESWLIKRGEVPVACLVPVSKQARPWEQFKGQVETAEDFDDPLLPELLEHFS